MDDCSLKNQISDVRQSNFLEGPQNPAISTDVSNSGIAPESQTRDLPSTNGNDASRNGASFAVNQSPMPQALHSSNANSTLPQPLTEELLPENEAENLSPKQESLDARCGQTSKKSKSLKQYFKRMKPT
jgi:hypothetical protein